VSAIEVIGGIAILSILFVEKIESFRIFFLREIALGQLVSVPLTFSSMKVQLSIKSERSLLFFAPPLPA
jgi:hypothetical protein